MKTKPKKSESVGVLNFKKARAEAKKVGSGISVPDSLYICRLKKAEWGSNDKGEWCQLQFPIIDGDEKGKTLSIFGRMEQDRIPYFLRDLTTLGGDVSEVESVDDLKPVVADLVKASPVVKLKVVTKGEYTNVYLQKLLDDDAVDALDLDGGDSEDEDEAPEADDEDEDVEDADDAEDDDTDTEDEDADAEDEDEDEEPEAEDEAEVNIGSSVIFKDGKKSVTGEVVALNEKKGTLDIKVGKKVHKGVSVEDVTLADD